jgi:hypothetical protein
MIHALFTSGRAIDLILVLVAVEFAALAWRRRRGASPGAAILDIALWLAPGVCLLMALRCALTGAPWTFVWAWLAASLPVHVADLIRRRS